MISVLVVDDSALVRRVVTDALGEDPEISVVGAAANGKLALAKIEQLAPDLVTLDIEMPVLRRNVSFKMLNLAAPLPSLPAFDVIFLRNVLIYVDIGTKRAVLRRVRSLLRPGGWLFLGSAETTIGINGDFERVAARRTSVYRPGAAQRALVGA